MINTSDIFNLKHIYTSFYYNEKFLRCLEEILFQDILSTVLS